MKLPEPALDSAFSLEKALYTRRSVRAYAPEPLSLAEVSQLLWAAQGVTDASGERTAPSAGATYPLEVYLVAGNVTDLAAGIYNYDPASHSMTLYDNGDCRAKLAQAAGGQVWVLEAPVSLIFVSSPGATTQRYPEKGERYVNMEAGHAAQNVYLQAAALGLGTVSVGAFDAAAVKRMLWLLPHVETLLIMPAGKMAQGEKSVSEFKHLTIHEAHKLLKSRQISSVELTRSMLERIEAVDPKVRAFMTVTGDLALKQAAEADKRIAGGDCQASYRRARRHEGRPVHQGRAHHLLLQDAGKLRAAL